MTNIKISNELWIELNKRKLVGESFDGVINRLLGDICVDFKAISAKETIGDLKKLNNEVLDGKTN